MTKHPLFHRLAVTLRSLSSIAFAAGIVIVIQTFNCSERTRSCLVLLLQLLAATFIFPIFLSIATAANAPDGRIGQSQQPLVPATGPPFSIVGTNDFNGDGKPDILWHNSATGELQIWFMNGPTLVRRATVDAALDGGGAKVGPPFAIMKH